MKKFVDVQANYPVSGVTGFVRGRLNNVEMSVEDIFKCLCCRATVIENIGGRKIKLTFNNYNKNNAPEVKPVAVAAENTPVNTEPVQNPEPENTTEETPAENTPVATTTEEAPTTAVDEETTESESTETTDDTTEVTTDDEETVSEDGATETENSDESTDSETIPANVNVPRNKKHRR